MQKPICWTLRLLALRPDHQGSFYRNDGFFSLVLFLEKKYLFLASRRRFCKAVFVLAVICLRLRVFYEGSTTSFKSTSPVAGFHPCSGSRHCSCDASLNRLRAVPPVLFGKLALEFASTARALLDDTVPSQAASDSGNSHGSPLLGGCPLRWGSILSLRSHSPPPSFRTEERSARDVYDQWACPSSVPKLGPSLQGRSTQSAALADGYSQGRLAKASNGRFQMGIRSDRWAPFRGSRSVAPSFLSPRVWRL